MAISTGARQIMKAYGLDHPKVAEEIATGKSDFARAVRELGPGKIQYRNLSWCIDGRPASDAMIIALWKTRSGTKAMN